MEGGTLIGVGSYGCVFDTPLKCSTKTKQSKQVKQDKKKQLIGKITLTSDAEQEVAIANILRKAPLWKNFFILAEPESCKLAPLKQQTEDEISECAPLERIKYSDMTQIYFPWGGRQFGNIFYSENIRPDTFNFHRFIIHVLEGVGTMAIAGVCHFDLHPGNMVLDENGVARIIDFGMAFNATKITQKILDNRWKKLTFQKNVLKNEHWISNQEAPEITIMNAINNGYSIHDAIQNVVIGKDIFKELSKPLFGIPIQKSIQTIEHFWKTSKSASKKDWVSLWSSYWTGYDSWALGTIFHTVLMVQLRYKSFTEQAAWKEKRTILLTVIRGLLEPNPRERLDVIEALALVDPGNSWLARFGGISWLREKENQRALTAASFH